MKKSAEKIGQLLNYEKFSNMGLLNLPQVEKKDIPDFIQCPKYEKKKGQIKKSMERETAKIDRITNDLKQMKQFIEELKKEREKWRGKAKTGIFFDNTNANDVAKQHHAVDMVDKCNNKIDSAAEKHDELIDKLKEAEEEAQEKLEELTLEALSAIDEDIPMVINRIEGIASNFAGSDDAGDLIAAVDVCLIGLRVNAMFDELIDDNSARKECKEGIAKINQTFSTLCADDSVQNYMVDIYRRNLDLVQKNAGISQQIDGVLSSVDQKQLDVLSKSIDEVLEESFDTVFNYSNVIDPAKIDKIVDRIKNTIDSLKLNIEKANALQAAETPAVLAGKAGVNAEQQAKSLSASMQKNADALEAPLTQNHFAVQIIDEAVIDDFYQKDLRVAVAALRKHIVDTIGEQSFESVLAGGDDRFSLKKAQTAIEKANLTRLQTTLDKIPGHIRELTEKITNAESDAQKANEVPKKNADALSNELGGKYNLVGIPLIGLFIAISILNRVKAFEPAFRGTNQIYKDLGKVLLEKNKKMNMVAMIIGAILCFGSLIFFAVSGGPVVVSLIVLVIYAVPILMLFLTGKKLQSFLGVK